MAVGVSAAVGSEGVSLVLDSAEGVESGATGGASVAGISASAAPGSVGTGVA
jgi:hypothetical protein